MPCYCSEGYICSHGAMLLRPPCTCAPGLICAVCIASGEVLSVGMRSPGHEAEMDRYAVARLVREWRAAQRLSTVRAAEVLGLAKSVLSDLEHARTRYPTGPTLTALRDIVGVPASYLTSSATLPQVDGLTLATLPAYLRQYRRVHGLTQEQMAEDLDCSPQTVKSLEYGKTQPSAKLLTALSAVLGVSIALTSQEETRP